MAPAYRRSAVDAIGDACIAGLSRATTCVGQRNTRKYSAGPVMASTEMYFHAAISRIWYQASLAHAKRPALHGSTPPSPDVCVRKRDRPPLHSMCWTGMQSIRTCLPDSLITPPSGSSTQPDENTQPHGGEVSCGLPPDRRHRGAARCQRSFCEKTEAPHSDPTKRCTPDARLNPEP